MFSRHSLQPFALSRRHISSVTDIYEKAIAEENIWQCIDRLKRIRLGPKLESGAFKNRAASVVVPFCHDPANGKPCILITERSLSLSKHRGEMCFPGGFEEKNDTDFVHSACRELVEEIGADPADIHVYGSVNPISFKDFALHPVLGYLKLSDKKPLKINKDEVEKIYLVPIAELAEEKNWHYTKWKNGWTTPVFFVNQNNVCQADRNTNVPRIWGMTSSILYIVMANLMPKHFRFDSNCLNRG